MSVSNQATYDECASCNHYRAYHDSGRPCRAWNPDEEDSLCACKGWKQAKTAVKKTSVPPPDRFDWVKWRAHHDCRISAIIPLHQCNTD